MRRRCLRKLVVAIVITVSGSGSGSGRLNLAENARKGSARSLRETSMRRRRRRQHWRRPSRHARRLGFVLGLGDVNQLLAVIASDAVHHACTTRAHTNFRQRLQLREQARARARVRRLVRVGHRRGCRRRAVIQPRQRGLGRRLPCRRRRRPGAVAR